MGAASDGRRTARPNGRCSRCTAGVPAPRPSGVCGVPREDRPPGPSVSVAVICTPGLEFMKSGDGGCMPGASCQSIQGTGICTYPDSSAQTFAFNLNVASVAN